ncbi:MAG: hypothetical protein ACJAXK_000385 [Yoonia sp.]|jgi:hypothetical protein
MSGAQKPRLRSNDELIRSVLEVAHGITNPLNIWGPIIIDPAPNVPETTTVIGFPIFIECVKDVARAPNDIFPKIKEQVENSTSLIFQSNLREIFNQCSFAADLIDTFTANEQIYLSCIRNRFVHGYLDGTTRENRKVWVFEKFKATQKPFTNTELTDIVKTVKKGTDGETIARLREKTAKALMTYSNETSQFVGVADDLELALRNDWLIISDTRSTFNSLNVSE